MLGTPPAFVLSQDQTLKKLYLNNLSVAQISFLNNLLLAYTQEFSLAVNSIWIEILNNPFYKLSKVFIVRLCVIQFTRYILFAAANFDIITQLSAFVKHFFQVFANFFQALFLSCASLERLRILADIVSFVKRFFQFFTYIFTRPRLVSFPLFSP